MKSNTMTTSALAAALVLATLTPTWATFWAGARGVYENGSTRVRVLPVFGGSQVAPQSTRVFDTALRIINDLAAEARRAGFSVGVITRGSGASSFIDVNAGRFGSGTVTVRLVNSSIADNSAVLTTRISARGLVLQDTISRSFNVVENFQQNPQGGIVYSSSSTDPEFSQFNTGSINLGRISTGSGTETDPILPINPSWISSVIIVVTPIFLDGRPTRVDPPYAKGFEYLVKSGRSEKIAKVVAPRGFGPRIKVFAASRRNGPLRFVGTVASGRSISLTRFPGLAAGAAKVRLQGMNPRPDLSTDAPYPVGFTFRNLREANTVLEIKPIKAS